MTGFFVAIRKAFDAGFNPSFVVRFGVPQRGKQQIGNSGHRGNHRQHGPPRCLFRADGRGNPDPFGGAHAGAAEFHNKQIVH
jgi:hypothetical protein